MYQSKIRRFIRLILILQNHQAKYFRSMLNKSDLKGTLVYLLSDISGYVNGQNIVVDDGFSI